MGKSGCLPPGSCRWIVHFKKSMNARMAKFKNDFRKKFFRDNKHLGTLGADKVLNETGNRDMEITKKTTKPTADSTVPHKKVAKKLTYDYQPSLYTEESSCEKQPTPVVMKSGLENKRHSSPNRRDSSEINNKAIVSDPVTMLSKEEEQEELDQFVNQVIRNSVAFLNNESNALYLIKESTENMMTRYDSNVDNTGGHVIKDTDITNEHVVIDTDTTVERVVIETGTTNERVVIDTDTTNKRVVTDTDNTNEHVVIDNDTTVIRVVIDDDTTNERVVIDTDTTNERVVINTDTTNQHVVIDTDRTVERVVIDTNTTNEHVVIDTDTTNEDVINDTNTTNVHIVIDTDTTNEHVVIVDTDTTVELVVKDTDTTNEYVIIDTDTTVEHAVKDTDNISESSSVLSAIVDSAVKSSLYEMAVIDNVNHSAVVPRSAGMARKTPRTVNDFLEMLGMQGRRNNSNLDLPDVDI